MKDTSTVSCFLIYKAFLVYFSFIFSVVNTSGWFPGSICHLFSDFQPLLREEELRQQERDSIRPGRLRSVTIFIFSSLNSNGWCCTDLEQAKLQEALVGCPIRDPENKWFVSNCLLHLIDHSCLPRQPVWESVWGPIRILTGGINFWQFSTKYGFFVGSAPRCTFSQMPPQPPMAAVWRQRQEFPKVWKSTKVL